LFPIWEGKRKRDVIKANRSKKRNNISRDSGYIIYSTGVSQPFLANSRILFFKQVTPCSSQIPVHLSTPLSPITGHHTTYTPEAVLLSNRRIIYGRKWRESMSATHIKYLFYLSIYLWLYSPLLNPGRFFTFLILYTVGRIPWTGDQPVARLIST
jgi:hypothetical protein